MMSNDSADGLLSEYAAAWAKNDPALIAALWDQDETQPFYKAEEVETYFHKHEDIMRYWQHNQRFHETIRLQFEPATLQRLGDELAIVFIKMRWDIRFAKNAQHENGAPFASAGKAMGGDNHVLAMVRATPQGLRFVGWNETPDAPISYMRQLYERTAAADI